MSVPLCIHCALSPWYPLVLFPSHDSNSSSVPHASAQSLTTFPSHPMLPFPACKLAWGCIAAGVLKLHTYANWLNSMCVLNGEVAGQAEQMLCNLAIFSLQIQQLGSPASTKTLIFMKPVEASVSFRSSTFCLKSLKLASSFLRFCWGVNAGKGRSSLADSKLNFSFRKKLKY